MVIYKFEWENCPECGSKVVFRDDYKDYTCPHPHCRNHNRRLVTEAEAEQKDRDFLAFLREKP